MVEAIKRQHAETGEEFVEVALDQATQAMLFTDGMLIMKQGNATILLSEIGAMHLTNLVLAQQQKGQNNAAE
jgi:hypothetical protein